MKAAAAIACLFLCSCVIGVDERGDWNIRPDPYTLDKGFDYLIRHEADSKGSDVVYVDEETGEVIDPADYPLYEIEP